ncbi:MAG: hypothetical protein QM669_14230 [Siphonobacter sp.]
MNYPLSRHVSYYSLFLVLSTVAPALAQRTLSIQSEPLTLPSGIYELAEVQDERVKTDAIGLIVQPSGQYTSLRLPNSLPVTFTRLLNSPRNGAYQIIVRVKECWFQESHTGQRVTGRFRIGLAFERKLEDSILPLTECQSGVEYTRSLGIDGNYEIQLRQTLERCFREFDQWLKTNQKRSDKLAQRVEVRFKEYTPRGILGDTVFYSPKRPVTWSDFTGPIHRTNPRYGATIFTSFGYEAITHTENGTLVVDMMLKVYMLKNSSWTAEPASNGYALAHEQLHFDITHLVAERFKRTLLKEELPVDEYDSRIQYLFLDAFREMNHYQEQYDLDSSHSINQAGQARWVEKVRKELKELQ